MTADEFALIARLIRSREPVKTAARLVLVEGRSNAEAVAETGVSQQSVSNTVSRFKAEDQAIRIAYKVKAGA